MKIKFSLLLCGLCCMIFSSNLMADRILVGGTTANTGTYSTAGTYGAPFMDWWDWQWMENLYSAVELSAAGFVPGMEITSFSIRSGANNVTLANYPAALNATDGVFTLSLTNTTLTVLPNQTTAAGTNYQTVYSTGTTRTNNLTANMHGDTLRFDFSEPFTYTGDGIIVYFCVFHRPAGYGAAMNWLGDAVGSGLRSITRQSSMASCGMAGMSGATSAFRLAGWFDVSPAAPVGQIYENSSVGQSSITSALPLATNVPVIWTRINVSGNVEPYQELNSITFDSKASYPNIIKATLFKTSSPIFLTSNKVAEISVASNNPITFTGLSSVLTEGDNYFWLAYDIAAAPADGAEVDAYLANFTMSKDGASTTIDPPTVPPLDPNGVITITVPVTPPVVHPPHTNTGLQAEHYSYMGMGYYDPSAIYEFNTSYYGSVLNEHIYFGSELGNEAFEIKNFAFQIYDNQTANFGTMHNVSVWMANTSDMGVMASPTNYLDDIDTSVASGYVKVISNKDFALPAASAGDWFVMKLDVPFNYGGDNLKILIIKNEPSLSTTGSYHFALSNNYFANLQNTTSNWHRVSGRYWYKANSGIATWTKDNTTLMEFRPITAFNKLENGEIANTGISKYKKDVTFDGNDVKIYTTHTEQPSQYLGAPYPSFTSTITATHDFLGRYANSFYNVLYTPEELGSEALGNCARLLKKMTFNYYGRYSNASYAPTTSGESFPVEIWVRHLPVGTTSLPAATNPTTYYNGLAAAGFVKVFEGAYPMTGRTLGSVEINLLSHFEYDGTRPLEVFMYSHNPVTTSGTAATDYYLFQYYRPQTTSYTTYNDAQGRGCYVNGATKPTTWTDGGSSGTGMKLSAAFTFGPLGQTISQVSILPSTVAVATDTSFNLIHTIISTEGACNPYIIESYQVDLDKMPTNVILKSLSLWTTGNTSTFDASRATLLGNYLNPISGMQLVIPVTNASAARQMLSGNNHIWITAEVDFATPCGALMSIQADTIIMSGDKYYRGDFVSDLPNVTVDYPVIRLTPLSNLKICENASDEEYTFNFSGAINTLKWQKYIPNTGWVDMPGQTTNKLRVSATDVSASIERYRAIATPPAGGCIPSDTLETRVQLSIPISSASLEVNGVPSSEMGSLSTCFETTTIFVAKYEGNAAGFRWEYKTNGIWVPIPLSEIPTADRDTMYFTPNSNIFRTTEIRVVVTSEVACGNGSFASADVDGFPVNTYRKNQFTQQPPLVVNLCRGDRFFVNAVYDGEAIIRSTWVKDGYPIENSSNGVFDMITEVGAADAGVYWYEVVSDGCNGLETIISNKVTLVLNADPEILFQTDMARAQYNGIALLKIEANYAVDINYPNTFQWYRYDAVTNLDIMLEESHNLIGVNSNILAIIPISNVDYSYNGDYYFCELRARCSDVVIRSGKMFLLPGVKLVITQQPENQTICEGTSAQLELSILAASSENSSLIQYQWLEDGIELSDNATFTGVTTPTLTINYDGTQMFGQLQCKIWYLGDDPAVDFLLSEEVAVIVSVGLPNDGVTLGDVDVEADEGNNVVFSIIPIDNVTYRWTFTDLSGTNVTMSSKINELVLPNLSLADQGTYSLILENACGSFVIANWILVVVPGIDATGINESMIETSLQIIPNPVSHLVSFVFDTQIELPYTADILNVAGEIVYTVNGITSNSGQNAIKIDVNALNMANGTYLFNIKLKDKVITKSFIVAK